MSFLNQLRKDLLSAAANESVAPDFSPGQENDRWNAARLLADCAEDMIYCTGKSWGVWGGGRFDFSDGKHRALMLADRLQSLVEADAREAAEAEFSEIEIARAIREEIKKKQPEFAMPEDALAALRRKKSGALARHAVKCGNLDKMKKALELAEAYRRVSVDALDADPWAFTVPNGTVDLRLAAATQIAPDATPKARTAARAAWLKPHARDAFPSKVAGVEFDPAAECPEWRAFLELTLPHDDVRACFQRSMGAMLFGRNEPQVAYLFRGSGGNGKSTAVNAVANVLGLGGGYAVPCKIEMFLAMQNESAGRATPEEVDCPGARALIASEPEPTDELSAKKIKALTGGDPRPVRGLQKEQFYYRPTGFPILSFNRTPRIKNEDEGTRRRLIFFPFEVNLRSLPADKRRSPVAVDEALASEGSGILNWMLEGWREYRLRADAGIGTPPGIDPPEEMLALKNSLLEHADPVGEFIKDCCDTTAAEAIRTSTFYKVYAEWCEMTGSALYGKQTVTRIMQEKGINRKKDGGGIMNWSGLRWQQTGNMAALLTKCGETPPPMPRDVEIDPAAPF